MAIRKPLVLDPVTGHPEQLQPGDSLDPSSVLGALYQALFMDKGHTKNEWLHHASAHIRSNESPFVIPWTSKIQGISFSNEDSNADMDFEVYRSLAGSGNASSLVYTMSVVNSRVAYTTAIPEIILNPGDKIAVFGRKTGKSPDNTVITMFLRALDDAVGSGSENYNGDIST